MRNAEPYKIKMVEPIHLISREERKRKIEEVGYNLFALRAEDIYIDLLTDSGTGAMSDAQWAAMMKGDESYAGSRSFYRLQESVETITGYPFVIPTHQGRGAENILFSLLIQEGQYVLNNMHFDTTRAHVELKGGKAVNMIVQEAFDTEREHPFKGNMDLEKTDAFIRKHGTEQCAFIILTLTCNSAGGQPVSMENIRGVREIANRYGLQVIMDAARFAENAFFIQQREPGYQNQSISQIVLEMFSHADGLTMSAKKDGIVNIGGLIALREDETLFEQARAMTVPYEGFPTYGGMTGRDMDALAVGLHEVLDHHYLMSRVGQVEYLADLLMEQSIPIQRPAGGHAVFVDCRKFCPHIPYDQFPAQSVCVELYREAGIRGVEVGSFLLGRDPDTGKNLESPVEFLRLTIPRRVYTDNHMRVVAEALQEIWKRRDYLTGYTFTYEPKVLRHFTARLRPVQ